MREWVGEREVPGRAMGVIVGGDFSDPTNERIILLSAAGLVLIGVGLLIGTIVWWHRGRQEHPVLAPLEVMGGRAWAKAPEADRRRRLDQVRLAGAGATGDELVHSDQVDLEALVRNVPQAFDDLREPGKIVVVPGEDIDQPEAWMPAQEPGAVVEGVEVAADASVPAEVAIPEVACRRGCRSYGRQRRYRARTETQAEAQEQAEAEGRPRQRPNNQILPRSSMSTPRRSPPSGRPTDVEARSRIRNPTRARIHS